MFSIDSAPQTREPFNTPPAGIYRVAITDLELKTNAKSEGSHFAFSFTIVSPNEVTGARILHRCTYDTRNETAKQIGHGQIADLMFTIQLRAWGNADEFKRHAIGKELVIETELEEGDDGTLWPRVINTWSLGGKHRNEKRSNPNLQLGPTGKPVKARKRSGSYSSNSTNAGHDVPF